MISELKRLTDAVHAAGSLVFAQINHAGSAAVPSGGEKPLLRRE